MTTEHIAKGTLGAIRAAEEWLGDGLDLIEHEEDLLRLAQIIDEETHAPELLAALKGIVEGGNIDKGTYRIADIEDIEKARAIIAAATK